MNRLFDLRFVIGAFFTIIAIVLLIYGFTNTRGAEINRYCGAGFLVFGVIMLVISRKK